MNASMRWMAIGSTFLVFGCSTREMRGLTGGEPTPAASVQDEHFSRIPQEQMGEIRKVRGEIQQVQDRLAHEEHAARMADQRVAVQQKRLEAIDCELEAAREAADLARMSGKQPKIQVAQERLERLEARRDVMEARVELATRQRDQQLADTELAEAQLAVLEAQLEHAKYRALEEMGDVAAERYEETAFLDRIQEARDQLVVARTDQQRFNQYTRAARARLQEAQQRLDIQPVGGEEDEDDLFEEAEPEGTEKQPKPQQ